MICQIKCGRNFKPACPITNNIISNNSVWKWHFFFIARLIAATGPQTRDTYSDCQCIAVVVEGLLLVASRASPPFCFCFVVNKCIYIFVINWIWIELRRLLVVGNEIELIYNLAGLCFLVNLVVIYYYNWKFVSKIDTNISELNIFSNH